MGISDLPRKVKKLAKKNFVDYQHPNTKREGRKLLKRIKSNYMLWNAFVWQDTKQGNDYWLKWALKCE